LIKYANTHNKKRILQILKHQLCKLSICNYRTLSKQEVHFRNHNLRFKQEANEKLAAVININIKNSETFGDSSKDFSKKILKEFVK